MNQVKAGAVLNYVIIGLNTILGLLYTPYMLRMLGQNEYGLYSLVASVIAYLTILDFGFGNAVIRYTAKFRSKNQLTEQWELFGMFIVIYSAIGLISFGAGLGLYFNTESLFDRTMSPEEISQAKTMIMLLILNLTITFPLSVFGSIITAYEEFVFQKVVSILRLILSTLVIVALLYVGYKAIALVVVQTVFNIATLILNFFYCKYRLKIKILFKRFNWRLLREITLYSFWIFLNVIMDRVYWSTGQFVLGAISGTVAVAIYSVAITLMHMYMTVSTGINSVLLPRITGMVAKKSTNQEIANLFIRTGRLQFIVISLFLSGFILFGQKFIQYWAGSDYDSSYIITVIFFVALFIPLIQNTGITVLQARNQMKFRSLLYIAIAAVSLLAQIILSKYYGAVGCAYAVGGALLLGQGLIMNIYYEVKQKLDIPKFWCQIGKMSVIPIVFTVIGYVVLSHLNIENMLQLILAIVIYILVYCPAFYYFSLNQYEQDLMVKPIIAIVRKLHK